MTVIVNNRDKSALDAIRNHVAIFDQGNRTPHVGEQYLRVMAAKYIPTIVLIQATINYVKVSDLSAETRLQFLDILRCTLPIELTACLGYFAVFLKDTRCKEALRSGDLMAYYFQSDFRKIAYAH